MYELFKKLKQNIVNFKIIKIKECQMHTLFGS